MSVQLTAQNFEETVLKAKQPFLVDFWAKSCKGCREVGQSLEELAHEYAGKALFGKVNVDFEREVAEQYGVDSFPAVLVFRNGDVVDLAVGSVPKSQLAQLIENNLK